MSHMFTWLNGFDHGPMCYRIDIVARQSEELIGRYIGKTVNPYRRQKEYERGAIRCMKGLPRCASTGQQWRRIHHALVSAYKNNDIIEFVWMGPPDQGETLLQAEKRLIKFYNSRGTESWQLNG